MPRKFARREGFALTEMLLATLCSMMMLVVVFTMYGRVKNTQVVADLATAIGSGVENLKTYYSFDGNYSGITADNKSANTLQHRGAFPKGWSCLTSGSATTCSAPQGIKVSVKAEASNSAFSYTLANVSQEVCEALATQQMQGIYQLDVGSTKITTFPAPISSVTAGCLSANRVTVKMYFK